MRFLRPLLAAAMLVPVLAINACKKSPEIEKLPEKGNTVSGGQDTLYTAFEEEIIFYKLNKSDLLPYAINMNFLSKDGRRGSKWYTASVTHKDDSLSFYNNGDKEFISAGNIPKSHSDDNIVFSSEQSQRMRWRIFQHGNATEILKPANKDATIRVMWRIDDITEPYNAEKERQRTNATIDAVSKGKALFYSHF